MSHLHRLGFEVVDRNWRPSRRGLRGELDVVARRDELVVVCEVKARRGSGYGGAAMAVDATKQERIRTLALAWLDDHDALDCELRFDVITVEGTSLEHYEAAF